MFDDEINDRSSGFFDEFDEREIMDEVHGIGQGLNPINISKQDILPDSIEASFYALENVQSFDDLVMNNKDLGGKIQSLTKIRVMHCTNFTSLKGINVMSKLQDLNLSSNNIMNMNGIEMCSNLVTLNLSCNKIQVINGLFKSVRTLKTLIISHNRIVTLNHLAEISQQSRLEILDLTDNYVGELSQIKSLQNFSYLKELCFRKIGSENHGSNPVCDFSNYTSTVQMFCTGLEKLDGISSKIVPRSAPTENKKIKLLTSPIAQPVAQVVSQYPHDNSVVQKLQTELKQAQERVSNAEQDRQSALQQFDQNESLWQKKMEQKEKEHQQLLRYCENLKADENQSLQTLANLNARIKTSERDLEQCERERIIVSEKLQSSLLQVERTLNDCNQLRHENQNLQRLQTQLQNENENLCQNYKDTKNLFKEAEIKVQQCLKQISDMTDRHQKQQENSQQQLEQASATILAQVKSIERLTQQVSQLKEINNQLEGSVTQKYKEQLKAKDSIYEELCQKTTKDIFNIQRDHENQIQILKQGFSTDIRTIYDELTGDRNKCEQQVQILQKQLQETQRQCSEFRILKDQSEKIAQKNQALASEMQIAFEVELQKLKRQEENLSKEYSQQEVAKKELKIKESELTSQFEDHVYKNKQLETKLRQTCTYLEERDKEIERLCQENEANKRKCKQLSQQLSAVQADTEQEINNLKRVVEEREIELDSLSDRIETKEVVVNDQAHQIQQLKKEIQKLNDEAAHSQDSKHNLKEYYEDQLQKEIDESEQTKSQLKCTVQELQDLEQEFESLRNQYDQISQEKESWEEQIQFKDKTIDEVLEAIEAIRVTMQQNDQKTKDFEDDLRVAKKQIESRDDEIKRLITDNRVLAKEIENNEKNKQMAVGQVQKQLEECRDELTVVVQEFQRKEREAKEQLKRMESLFR